MTSEVMATNRELADEADRLASIFLHASADIEQGDRAGFERAVARALELLDSFMDHKAARP